MLKKIIHTPDGVRDIYGKEQQRKLYLEDCIRKVIYSYGYEDIQTPSFEYFDVFSKEIGTTSSKELYKFFDKNGDTLCLRPDFTPSVARCVAKYFSDTTTPIKLTYLGNTFVNNSNLQGKLKETTEIGVELFNDDSAVADAETINLVIESLKSTGLNEFQIVLGNMEYFKGICESAGISSDDEYQLREFISSKNYALAEELIDSLKVDNKHKKLLMMTGEYIGDACTLKSIKEKINNVRSKNALLRLEKVYDLLKVFGNEKYVSFDLGMLSKYNYYTGIIFKAYTYGLGEALVKGGRYDSLVESFGSSKPAVGFVIVVDDLMLALRSQNINVKEKEQPQIVSYNAKNLDEQILKAIKLRKEGKAVSLVAEEN
ncbi:MAG: ATP phosphoribosyltransferase regulatory subunit [Lachnospiraceae bacterium]|nr:ATP phosphoribosyltransferase regulatory subunit [Lachnospiraceae bacterium]